MFSLLLLKCIDFLLKRFAPSILLSQMHRRHGVLDDRNPEKFASSYPLQFWSQDPSGFVGVSSVPFLFWSRPQERPMTAREFASIVHNCLQIIFTSFCISFFSPCNVVVHWQWRWSCLWSAQVHTVGLSLDFESSRGGLNVVIPREYFPLELRRHTIDSIHILEVIASRIPFNFAPSRSQVGSSPQ